MDVESRIAARPSRLAGLVHESYSDWHVDLLVRQQRDFLSSLIVHGGPLFLQCNRVEVVGLDFLKFGRVNFCKPDDHLEQRKGAESGVFPASRPKNGFERVTASKFNNVHVIAGLLT